MATAENLKDAFAGESQANRKYLAFAKKAEAEGFKQVAKLFRAAAEAETIHAHAHLRVMGGVKTTAENLQSAMNGEGYEFQTMYPKFLAEAKAEGNKAAAMSFKCAMAAEKIHHRSLQQALKMVKAGKDLNRPRPFTSARSAATSRSASAPDKCAICGAPKDKFSRSK